MIIHTDIKNNIQNELMQAKSVWIASAMISQSGWMFLQENIPKSTNQYYLIGIDLATDPNVFQSILDNAEINARIYETQYTFHPKVYIIQTFDNLFVAFIGSSNTTSWGLEKNIEMNFKINDQKECKKLLDWFNSLYQNGYMITQFFLQDYKEKFTGIIPKTKRIQNEVEIIKSNILKDKGQFFSTNQHTIFNEKYHRVNSKDFQMLRREVRDRLLELHNIIYPKFKIYGLTDLYCHHQYREIVSRHFFNQYSGNYINAMWLHYGKSLTQLQTYTNGDESINKPDSFINNIRMQVIVHEDSVGIWLVVGRNNGSKKDREYFREQMQDKITQKKFYDAFKRLGKTYWINVPNALTIKDIKTQADLLNEIQKEKLDQYFIIGCDIDRFDKKLSDQNIYTTVLEEFQKLYSLYDIMRHK